jgi:hypothetical protein
MTSNPNQVIVTNHDGPGLSVQISYAYHRDFPEMRGEGNSPRDAVGRLAERLSATLDGAPSDWRRERIERAIEDVRAFVQQRR